MVAVFQLFVIIIINVGYKIFHFVLISNLISYKFICSISPGILNVILTYKITEVILEGGFVFVFCKRESKYVHMVNSSLNTSVKVVEKPVINLGCYLGSSCATLS